jgi:hypothetical protein
VTLVQVEGVDGEAERVKHLLPADPEHDLLLEASDIVASVEPVRDRPVAEIIASSRVSSRRTGTAPPRDDSTR